MMELATQEKIIERELAYNVGTETKLSPGEKERFDAAVKVIDEGMNTFLSVGAALLTIRGGKLYRETHPSFEAFCKAKWSMSRPRAYQLIAAVKVVNNLSRGMVSTTVDKPTSERHVRVLAALPPGQQAEAWQEAVDTAPKSKVTAVHVQSVVDQYKIQRQPGDFVSPIPRGRAYATEAITRLKMIDKKDRQKMEAGIEVIVWCARNLTGFDAALKAVKSLR